MAKAAGVSTATISYVLNNSGSVSKLTREKILRLVKEMGYRPNHAAKTIRTGKTQTLGLVLPDICNPFFPELAQSVENAARHQGYSVFLIDSQGRTDIEVSGVERLVKLGVEGIVWCPAANQDTLKELVNDIPVVIVDRPLPGYDSVSSDYIAGGEILAKYIMSKGHKKIGMVTGPLQTMSARERRDGFVSKLTGGAVIEWENENEFSVELSLATKTKLKESNAGIIICGNDLIAIGVILELNKLNIHVPHDVSVVGFDNIPFAKYVSPSLTTIHQSFSKLGHEAINLLVRRIENNNLDLIQLKHSVRLEERESVIDRKSNKGKKWLIDVTKFGRT